MGIIKTRKIVQGAMIAGIFGLLSLINTYTGEMFDIFIGYAMVIGLVWYGYQYDLKDNIICAIACMIIVAMVSTPYMMVVALTSCLNGIAVSEMIKRKASLLQIFGVVWLVCFFNNFLIYEVLSGLLGMDLVKEMTAGYNMLVASYPTIAQSFPLEAIISMIPMTVLLISALEMYVIVMFLSLASNRLKFPFPKKVHIVNFRMSRKWGYIVAAWMFIGYGLTMVPDLDPIYGQYVYFLSYMAYVVQGVSTISFFGIVYNKRWLIIVGILTAFIGTINSIHTILGMIDIFSDLRKNILYNKQ